MHHSQQPRADPHARHRDNDARGTAPSEIVADALAHKLYLCTHAGSSFSYLTVCVLGAVPVRDECCCLWWCATVQPCLLCPPQRYFYLNTTEHCIRNRMGCGAWGARSCIGRWCMCMYVYVVVRGAGLWVMGEQAIRNAKGPSHVPRPNGRGW